RTYRRSCRTRRLEEADSIRRPVGKERLADEPALRHGAKEAAVLTVTPVVAHHEVHPLRDRDRLGEVAAAAAIAGVDEALVGLDTVHDRLPVDDPQTIPRAGDDPLDEVGARLLRGGFGAGRVRRGARAAFPAAADRALGR